MIVAYMQERWFHLLVDAVARDPRGKAGVAEKINAEGGKVSRPQISLVINGAYKASTRHIAAKVLTVFDRHVCPYLGESIDVGQCQEINTGPTPTWDPAALDQRRTCQTCLHRPALHAIGSEENQ